MYANETPTTPWRGAQSVPRALSLKRFPEGLRVVQQPVREIETLRGGRALRIENVSAEDANELIAAAGFRGGSLDIQAVIEVRNARDVGFRVLQGDGEETLVGFTAAPAEVYIDRTESGEAEFHETFAGRHSARLNPMNGMVELRILVDRSVVELFAEGGRVTITDRVFPRPDSAGLSLYSEGGEARIVSLEAWTLQSAWR